METQNKRAGAFSLIAASEGLDRGFKKKGRARSDGDSVLALSRDRSDRTFGKIDL